MDYIPLSDVTIHQFINNSKSKLDEVRNNVRKYRQEHLPARAYQYANQHSLSVHNAVAELISHEEARGTFRLLSRNLKQSDRTHLTTLWEAVNDQGEYTKDLARKKVYVETEQIHWTLLRRNARHLQQASTTPFATGWLKTKLKWDGTGDVSRQILSGELLNEYKFRSSMQVYLESIKVKDLQSLNTVRP